MDQPLRRCIGSATFGITPHDAPVGDFPVQPSQKDGLGRLCREHWRAYTGALRKAALARKSSDGVSAADREPPAPEPRTTRTIGARGSRGDEKPMKPADTTGHDAAPKSVAGKRRTTRDAAREALSPRATQLAAKAAATLAQAEAVLAATETLSGSAYTDAIGSDEVQAALEVLATGHGQPAPGDGVDGETEVGIVA